jgi:hypothetical protein
VDFSRLFSIPALTAVIAGLLILISFAQPLADRLQLPYTVVLAMIGVALAALASFLLYTPLANTFGGEGCARAMNQNAPGSPKQNGLDERSPSASQRRSR